MIFTAYMDESGTHGTSPVTIIAGAYGSAAQWQDVEARIHELESRLGFSMFHSKDLKDGDGSFKGWSSEQRLKLVEEFLAILADGHVEAGFIMQINNADYEKYYRSGDGPAPAEPSSMPHSCRPPASHCSSPSSAPASNPDLSNRRRPAGIVAMRRRFWRRHQMCGDLTIPRKVVAGYCGIA